jgi:hypothetical protein
MSFEKIADRKIREAMQEGEFDNLPNRGKRINLEEYFKWPADLRMAYSVLKSAGYVPEEVSMLKDIARLEESLAKAQEDDERVRIRKALDLRRTELGLALERAKRR